MAGAHEDGGTDQERALRIAAAVYQAQRARSRDPQPLTRTVTEAATFLRTREPAATPTSTTASFGAHTEMLTKGT